MLRRTNSYNTCAGSCNAPLCLLYWHEPGVPNPPKKFKNYFILIKNIKLDDAYSAYKGWLQIVSLMSQQKHVKTLTFVKSYEFDICTHPLPIHYQKQLDNKIITYYDAIEKRDMLRAAYIEHSANEMRADSDFVFADLKNMLTRVITAKPPKTELPSEDFVEYFMIIEMCSDIADFKQKYAHWLMSRYGSTTDHTTNHTNNTNNTDMTNQTSEKINTVFQQKYPKGLITDDYLPPVEYINKLNLASGYKNLGEFIIGYCTKLINESILENASAILM